MKNVSKICLFACCCDVLTIVCFKAKLRFLFFYVKQLSRIDFRGKLFGKIQNNAMSFGLFLFEVRCNFML